MGNKIEKLEKKAKKGSSRAMLELGEFYIEQNPEKGKQYFEMAIINGDSFVLHSIADKYREGKFLDKDLTKAVLLYEKAIEKNNYRYKMTKRVAMYNLGVMYMNSHDVDQNLDKARQYFRESNLLPSERNVQINRVKINSKEK